MTTHSHLTLFAVALLSGEDKTPTRKGRVYEEYETVVQTLDRDPLSDRSVHSHLNELTMLGILDRHEHNEGRAGGVYYEYELSVGVDTVCSALSDVRALHEIDVESAIGKNN